MPQLPKNTALLASLCMISSASLGQNLSSELIFHSALAYGGRTIQSVDFSTLAYNQTEHLRSGSGYQLGLGTRLNFASSAVSLNLSAAFFINNLSDSDAITLTRYPIETSVQYGGNQHSAAIGLSYHLNPVYRQNINGRVTRYALENAMGPMVEYRYKPIEWVEVGLKYTDMDYRYSGIDIQANSTALSLYFIW